MGVSRSFEVGNIAHANGQRKASSSLHEDHPLLAVSSNELLDSLKGDACWYPGRTEGILQPKVSEALPRPVY